MTIQISQDKDGNEHELDLTPVEEIRGKLEEILYRRKKYER